MATLSGLTAARMLAVEAASVVAGNIVGPNLILQRRDTSTFNAGQIAPPIVTALPGSPVDGQEVYYQNAAMATNGWIWHLRYRSGASGSYKWEFLGGSTWVSGIGGDLTTTSTSYVDLANVTPPTIALPLAGDYEIGFTEAYFAPGASGFQEMNIYQGAAATIAYVANTNAGIIVVGSGPFRVQGLTAATLNVKVRSANGVSVRFVNVGIYARPIRVG